MVEEIKLPEFLAKTPALLEEESIRVGVNWSGFRLTGYDVSVADERRLASSVHPVDGKDVLGKIDSDGNNSHGLPLTK